MEKKRITFLIPSVRVFNTTESDPGAKPKRVCYPRNEAAVSSSWITFPNRRRGAGGTYPCKYVNGGIYAVFP